MSGKERGRPAVAARPSSPPAAGDAGRPTVQPASEPAGVDPDEAASRLHSVAIHVVRRFARDDRLAGLSQPRLSALTVLAAGGPWTIGTLASIERVSAPTMTRLVAAMEADGLVARTPHPTDRRSVRVSTTERGTRLLGRAREQRLAALAAALSSASIDELRALVRATEVVERVLAEDRHR